MLEHWSDVLSLSWNSFFGITGIIFNIFLMFLFQKHTPEFMTVYRTVIRIGAVCDLTISLCAFLISARVYSIGTSIVMMFHGVARYFPISQNIKPYVCFFFFSFEIHGYLFSMFVIIFSLYYRQRTVIDFENPMTSRQVNWICYTFCCIALPYTIFLAVSNFIPLKKIDELVMDVKPELCGSGWTYYALLDISKFPDVVSEGLVFVLNVFTIIFGLVCRSRINKKLSALPMSETLKNMHKSLMKILLIQISSPLFQILALILHLVSTIRNDLQTPLLENSVELPSILLACLTPIFTIYYIKPYRDAFKRILGINAVFPISYVSEDQPNSKYTPEFMKIYRTVVRIGAICDFTISFCSFLISMRVYSTGTSIVTMFHGVVTYLPINSNIKPYICFFLYSFAVHGYLFSLFVIIFSLFYRQRIVISYGKDMTSSLVNWICYTFSCIALSFTIFLAFSNVVPFERIDEFIMTVRPELNGSGWTYYALLDITKFPDVISELLVFVLNWVTLIFGIICRSRINKKLSSLPMSEASKNMQKSLMKVLLIQIFSPFFEIIGMILHILSTFRNDLQTPPVENSIGLPLTLLATVTPIFTIYYIKPYRNAFKRILGANAVFPISFVSEDLPNSVKQI